MAIDPKDIMGIIVRKPNHGWTIEEIQKKLKTSHHKNKEILKCLQYLVSKKALDSVKKGKYQLSKNKGDSKFKPKRKPTTSLGLVTGTVQKNPKGFAFLVSNSTPDSKDIFIDPKEAEFLLNGDVVEVEIESRSFRGTTRYSGKVSKIIKRGVKRRLGVFKKEDQYGYVLLDDPYLSMPIFVKTSNQQGAKPEEVVLVEVTHYPDETREIPEGIIVQTFPGQSLTAKQDNLKVLLKHNLPIEFSEIVTQEASSIPDHVLENEKQERTDLTSIPLMTIDGITAKDFDDAVFCENKNNGFRLIVAIADVAHYVKPGSELDKEAFVRGFSIYFPNQVIPMLPENLSNGICSLNPNAPRLALACEIEFNMKGEKKSIKVYNAVFTSRYRGVYEEVEKLIQIYHENHSQFPSDFQHPYPEAQKSLIALNSLWRILRKRRITKGMLDLDIPEAEIIVDQNGDPTDIKKRFHLDSHKLIEECMIAANEAVTEYIDQIEWPFIYRTHGVPDQKSIENFTKAAKQLGFSIKEEDLKNPQNLHEFFKEIAEHPTYSTIQILLLRSMQQAEYTAENIGHFGLASPKYTHFTSPIRRYPDLVVHRILKAAIKKENPGKLSLTSSSSDSTEETLVEIGTHCSQRERKIMDAEREVIRIKKIRYMEKHLGEEFDGRISGVTEKGAYVELDSVFIDGRIALQEFSDDYYTFVPEKLILIGKRTKKTIKLGDRVRIQVARATPSTLEIDFHLIQIYPAS